MSDVADRVVWRRPVELDAPWLDVLADAHAAGLINDAEVAGRLRAIDRCQERCDRLADIIRAVNVLLPKADEDGGGRFAAALRRKLDEAVGEFNELSRYLRSVYS